MKTENRSVRCDVFNLKFAVCEEVASAICTGLPLCAPVETMAWERSSRSLTAPGRGAEEGKTTDWRTRCSA